MLIIIIIINLEIIHKIPDQHKRKARHQGATENSHIVRRTHYLVRVSVQGGAKRTHVFQIIVTFVYFQYKKSC